MASGATEAVTDPATEAAAAQSAAPPPGDRDWPAAVPVAVGPQCDQPVCFSTTPGAPAGDAPWEVRTSLPGVVLAPGEQPVFARSGDAPGLVDQIVVPRGSGALVRASPASGGDTALTLVTDSGRRFAVPTPDAAKRLRYDVVTGRAADDPGPVRPAAPGRPRPSTR